MTANAGAASGRVSKVPSELLPSLEPPSSRASASSTHNSTATASAANAASDRNACMSTFVLPLDPPLVRESGTFRPVAKRRTANVSHGVSPSRAAFHIIRAAQSRPAILLTQEKLVERLDPQNFRAVIVAGPKRHR